MPDRDPTPRPESAEAEAERIVVELAAARGPARSICPSEAARRLADTDGDWRDRMPAVHRAAERLAAAGAVSLLQRGVEVGPQRPRGAYRIRIRRLD